MTKNNLKNKISTILNEIHSLNNSNKISVNTFSIFFKKDRLLKNVIEQYISFSDTTLTNWVNKTLKCSNVYIENDYNKFLKFYLFEKHYYALADIDFLDKTFSIYNLVFLDDPHSSCDKKEYTKSLNIIKKHNEFCNMNVFQKCFFMYKWRFWKYKKLNIDIKRFLDLKKDSQIFIENFKKREILYNEQKENIENFIINIQKELKEKFISLGLVEEENIIYNEQSGIINSKESRINILSVYYKINKK